MLGDDLEAWLADPADEAHLPRLRADWADPRRFTGEEKSRRQVLFSTDLVYDVLRKRRPTTCCYVRRAPSAAAGLLDLKRFRVICSRAFRDESPTGNSNTFRRWRCP